MIRKKATYYNQERTWDKATPCEPISYTSPFLKTNTKQAQLKVHPVFGIAIFTGYSNNKVPQYDLIYAPYRSNGNNWSMLDSHFSFPSKEEELVEKEVLIRLLSASSRMTTKYEDSGIFKPSFPLSKIIQYEYMLQHLVLTILHQNNSPMPTLYNLATIRSRIIANLCPDLDMEDFVIKTKNMEKCITLQDVTNIVNLLISKNFIKERGGYFMHRINYFS